MKRVNRKFGVFNIYKIFLFLSSLSRRSLSAEDCDEKTHNSLQSSAERLQRGKISLLVPSCTWNYDALTMILFQIIDKICC